MINEPSYSLRSVDNFRQYAREISFSNEHRPSSRHGLICRETNGTEHSCILLASGGASGVHDHSIVIVDDHCYVAVGDMICSLTLPGLELDWATKVDSATCFGVYHFADDHCLLSHGELEIARLSFAGEIVWSVGGGDIFTEGFEIVGHTIIASDFNHHVYRIDVATGLSKADS